MTFNMEGSTMFIPSHLKRGLWLEKNNKEIGNRNSGEEEEVDKKKQETEEEEGDKEQNLRRE